MKKHLSDASFQNFHHQLFHSSVLTILQSFMLAMTIQEVVWYVDGHFWCTIYSLGPYITDYKEQVLLTCIVCGWCPWCQSSYDSLDNDVLEWTHAINEALFQESTLDIMWVKYGVVRDLVVCFTKPCHSNLCQSNDFTSIYKQFPLYRYSSIDCPGHPASACKGMFQESLSQLGHIIHNYKTHKTRSWLHPRWDWLQVSQLSDC